MSNSKRLFCGDSAFPHQDPCTYRGMTLLDYFAGQALAGIMSQMEFATNRSRESLLQNTAELAYNLAQRMLEERKKLTNE